MDSGTGRCIILTVIQDWTLINWRVMRDIYGKAGIRGFVGSKGKSLLTVALSSRILDLLSCFEARTTKVRA